MPSSDKKNLDAAIPGLGISPRRGDEQEPGCETKCNPWMGCVPDRTPAGVPEEAETQGQPIDDSIGFIPALLPERRGTANWFPGIAFRPYPGYFLTRLRRSKTQTENC